MINIGCRNLNKGYILLDFSRPVEGVVQNKLQVELSKSLILAFGVDRIK